MTGRIDSVESTNDGVVVELARDDLGIVNCALTLECLESDF
ncbi:MAG TPA: hypothetical protein VH279_14785 [Solirubrobacteraceae bacterium]|jgi:hypothetical protein|nr:hypothetical protein [Solirubrobacteraceae bacterium]